MGNIHSINVFYLSILRKERQKQESLDMIKKSDSKQYKRMVQNREY